MNRIISSFVALISILVSLLLLTGCNDESVRELSNAASALAREAISDIAGTAAQAAEDALRDAAGELTESARAGASAALSDLVEAIRDIVPNFLSGNNGNSNGILMEGFLPDPNLFHPSIAEQSALYAMLAYAETRVAIGIPRPGGEGTVIDRFYAITDSLLEYRRRAGDFRDISRVDATYFVIDSTDRNRRDHPLLLHEQLRLDGFRDIESRNYGGMGRHEASYTIAFRELENGEYLVAVIFRGTDWYQWYGNFVVGSGGRHYSFERANSGSRQNLEFGVQSSISMYILNRISRRDENAVVNFLITGHSRGGSIANLLAADLISGSFHPGVEVGNIYAYTFASPNTTQNPIAHQNIFNIVFDDDFATQFPLSDWGFSRYGITIRAEAEHHYNTNSLFNNAMARVTAAGLAGARHRPEFSEVDMNKLVVALRNATIERSDELGPNRSTLYAYNHAEIFDIRTQTRLGPQGQVVTTQVRTGTMTPFDFAYEHIAPLVIYSRRRTAVYMMYFQFVSHELREISRLFVNNRFYFANTHHAFTYWAALRTGAFETSIEDMVRRGYMAIGSGCLQG